jgi:hypothetical protein
MPSWNRGLRLASRPKFQSVFYRTPISIAALSGGGGQAALVTGVFHASGEISRGCLMQISDFLITKRFSWVCNLG